MLLRSAAAYVADVAVRGGRHVAWIDEAARTATLLSGAVERVSLPDQLIYRWPHDLQLQQPQQLRQLLHQVAEPSAAARNTALLSSSLHEQILAQGCSSDDVTSDAAARLIYPASWALPPSGAAATWPPHQVHVTPRGATLLAASVLAADHVRFKRAPVPGAGYRARTRAGVRAVTQQQLVRELHARFALSPDRAQATAWDVLRFGVALLQLEKLAAGGTLAARRSIIPAVLQELELPVSPAAAQSVLVRAGIWTDNEAGQGLPVPTSAACLRQRVDTDLAPATCRVSLPDASPVLCFDRPGTRICEDGFSLHRCRRDRSVLGVWVHVTDVASRIPHGSPLERAAHRRGGASYYSPAQGGGPRTLMFPRHVLQRLSLATSAAQPLTLSVMLDARRRLRRVCLARLPAPATPLPWNSGHPDVQAAAQFLQLPAPVASDPRALVRCLATSYQRALAWFARRHNVLLPSRPGGVRATSPLRRYEDFAMQQQVAAILTGSPLPWDGSEFIDLLQWLVQREAYLASSAASPAISFGRGKACRPA